MTKHFFHYLLLLTFSVFVITSNVHAMDMALADSQTQQSAMSDMHHSHVAMADCGESLETDKTCCDCDCSCMISHCNKSQSVISVTAINFTSKGVQQYIEHTVTVAENSFPPRKRPPKA